MVNSSKGAKTQIGIHFQVMRAQTCLYRSKRADGSIHRFSGKGVLAKTPCLRPNGLNGLSIGVSDCKLWRVLSRMKMPLRDTWWIRPRGLKHKLGYIFKFWERKHVFIGLKELMDLSIGYRGGVWWVWPPYAKIAFCVTDVNPSFRDGKGMPYWGCFIGGGWVS